MLINYSKLNLKQKQQIIELFNQGWECRSIPNQIGVSGRSVARVLNEAGINTKRRNRYTLNEKAFYNLVYQHENLDLERKKRKIEEILRSYRRGKNC